MKKIVLISFAALLALVSCNKELSMPEEGIKGNVTFKASIVETKTSLGDKEGTSWPNYWSAGDVISVNGVVSDPIDDSFVGKADAEFYVEGVAAPYNVAYPASAISEYEAGSATVTIPDEQIYVEGSYDSEAYIMLAKASGTTLDFVPQMAIFSITPTGTEGQVKSISLISLGGKKISGAFTTDFESLTAADGAFDSVTLSSNEGIDLGKPWMILIPASDFTEDGIKVIIEDAAGGVMTRTTKPSKAYVAGKMYSAEIPYSPDPLSLTHIASSSSSLVYEWGRGVAFADIASDYSVSLYSDQACANLVVSFDIAANNSCWDGREPRFTFGGLSPSTTYYCKVIDNTNALESDPVAATTEDFTVVDATKVQNAAVGDVILAEDFSEIGWGADMIEYAAGFLPTPKTLDPLSGTYSDVDYSLYNNTAGRIYGDTMVAADKRLYNWGFFGNSSVYSYAGYLRVGSSSSGARTHIVSPALSGIPEGHVASVDVTVTSCLYDSGTANDVAVFVNDHSSLNLELEPDQKEDSNFNTKGGKYTGASLEDGHSLGVGVKTWSTKTIRINGVKRSDCLIIGSATNIDKKNRFFLNDVKVEIVSMKVPGQIDEEMDINDFTTLKSFLTKCASGLTMKGNVTADITLSGDEEADISDLYPVEIFDGALVGGGFTISGLKKPLFKNLSGPVSNLTLESVVEIASAQNNVGIFAMKASSPAVLSNCVSKGSVAMSYDGTVSGNISVGGMVGYADNITFNSCVNQAAVSNSSTAGVGLMVGGLAGTSEASTYVGCANTAAVSNSGLGTDFSGMPCDISLGGIAGYLKGKNTLTGTSTAYNSNSGDITENSTSTYVGIGGIAGMNDGSETDMAYAKNTGDILYSGNTRANSYVGGILGCAHVECTMDYASNEGDLVFKSLTISKQLWIGGILGGFNAGNSTTKTASCTLTGCINSGTIDISGGSNGSNMAAASKSVTSYTYIGGISGTGDCTGKGYINCKNTGAIKAYMQLKLRLGGICGYTNINPAGCVNTGPINVCRYNPQSNGGNGDVGGIVGYANLATFSDLTNDATVRTTGSSPNCYTAGLIGHVGDNAVAFLRCKVGTTNGDSSGRYTISGASEGSFGSTAAALFASDGTANAWDFTDCVVKTGTKCQNVEITADNLSSAVIGRNQATSITNPPTIGSFE